MGDPFIIFKFMESKVLQFELLLEYHVAEGPYGIHGVHLLPSF